MFASKSRSPSGFFVPLRSSAWPTRPCPMTPMPPRSIPVRCPWCHRAASEGLAAGTAPLTPAGLAPAVCPTKRTPFADRAPAPAAVLLPLVMREQLTCCSRSAPPTCPPTPARWHFPAAKSTPATPTPRAAALREAEEEVGLPPTGWRCWAPFAAVHHGHGLHHDAGGGAGAPGFAPTPNADEVADVFEVPLDFLMDPANHRRHEFQWEGRMREWFSMPYREGDAERLHLGRHRRHVAQPVPLVERVNPGSSAQTPRGLPPGSTNRSYDAA
jgi:8-oxo-dGTP pyrophosphatase MutT (NUDIX family)